MLKPREHYQRDALKTIMSIAIAADKMANEVHIVLCSSTTACVPDLLRGQYIWLLLLNRLENYIVAILRKVERHFSVKDKNQKINTNICIWEICEYTSMYIIRYIFIRFF